MIYFVGAGAGAPDLITVRGRVPAGRGGCHRLCRLAGQPRAAGL